MLACHPRRDVPCPCALPRHPPARPSALAPAPPWAGGPHNHQIGALAVALKHAATPEFKAYAKQVGERASVWVGGWIGGSLSTSPSSVHSRAHGPRSGDPPAPSPPAPASLPPFPPARARAGGCQLPRAGGGAGQARLQPGHRGHRQPPGAVGPAPRGRHRQQDGEGLRPVPHHAQQKRGGEGGGGEGACWWVAGCFFVCGGGERGKGGRESELGGPLAHPNPTSAPLPPPPSGGRRERHDPWRRAHWLTRHDLPRAQGGRL